MRIASLSPAATEIIFALGKEKDLVCVDRFSNFPEEARGIAHLRDHQDIPAEDIRAFRPDVVLTATVVQAKLAAQLKEAGFPVIHQDPRTLAGVEESIQGIGILLDCEAAARAVIDGLRTRIAAVRRKGAMLGRRPRVYVEEWHDPPMASGNWVPELVTAAGGRAFPIPSGELSRAVTLQEVRAFDPDIVVLSWCGAGTLADPGLLTRRPGWEALRAVHGGHVVVLDDSLLNRPGPRLADGAQHLYGRLFPLLH